MAPTKNQLPEMNHFIVTRPSQKDDTQAWLEIDHLTAEIGARWPAGVSAAEAVAEDR